MLIIINRLEFGASCKIDNVNGVSLYPSDIFRCSVFFRTQNFNLILRMVLHFSKFEISVIYDYDNHTPLFFFIAINLPLSVNNSEHTLLFFPLSLFPLLFLPMTWARFLQFSHQFDFAAVSHPILFFCDARKPLWTRIMAPKQKTHW